MFNDYFSARYILEKGCPFNVCFSDRSDGKTFDCKIRALENYFKDKSQSVYLRRFKTEITPLMYSTYFNEILNIEHYKALYGHCQFKGDKSGVKISLDDGETWDYIVYFIVLTMSSKLKSQLDIQRIHNVDFDEYIPLDNRYIKDEMNYILELYKSIDRDRDILQFNFFANKITYYCPLLDYFGIDLSLSSKVGIRTYKNNSIAVQIYASNEHRKSRYQSKFQQAVEGTEYEEYASGGILNLLDIEYKSTKDLTRIFASFKTMRGEGLIYIDEKYNYVISSKTKGGQLLIVDKIYNDTRQQLMYNLGDIASNLKRMYRLHHMYFEDAKSFYLFEPILQKIK